MKVLGIGVDIIDNKRIKTSIKNSKFKNRIYSLKELKQSTLYKNKVNYFSKRFAAKEAFAKALGTGFRKNLKLKVLIVFYQFLMKKIIQQHLLLLNQYEIR